MDKPRNPTKRLQNINFDFIDRDYSLTEKQDYCVNVLPYVQSGYTTEARGEHMQGTFIVRGWRVSNDPSNSR